MFLSLNKLTNASHDIAVSLLLSKAFTFTRSVYFIPSLSKYTYYLGKTLSQASWL